MSVAPQGSKKLNPSNSPSKLLSNDENETLFRVMGARCQAQVSAVVQMFVTEPPNHSSWKKLHCGVATFTKDNTRRSYFIQVFDIMKEQKLFEQEIYNLFSYHISLPFFHQFEGENQMIGLNFADNQEAESFSKVITDRLESKQRKREERRRQQQLELSQPPPSSQPQPPTTQPRPPPPTGQPPPNYMSLSQPQNNNNNRNRARRGRRTNKIRKDQIGEPTNFKHVTHVGFDQDKGFSSFNANDELTEFFKMAGVSQHLLQDDNTRQFIYDFIDQHGGVERAAQETKVYGSIKRRGDPPTPTSAPKPALPSRNSHPNGTPHPPPPPPPRPHNSHPQAPPPPPPPKDRSLQEKSSAPTPPPAPTHATPPPPPPPRIPMGGGGGASHSPRTSEGVGAPPPPPPPPMGAHPPPPPAQAPAQAPAHPEANSRNDLLAQIRQRPALNPVSQQRAEKAPESTDKRMNLLSEIRNREYELKPVTHHEGETSPVAPVENTMAAMLAKALEGRAKVIQDESDSDDEDDEDDEWDDN